MEEVQDLIKKGVIAEVPPSAQQTGFYSAYFIIPKKRMRSLAYSRPQESRPIPKHTPIQNDSNKDSNAVHNFRRIVYIPHLKRCIFPHPDLSRTQVFSLLCFSRPSFPISGPTSWPVPGTEGLYSGGLGDLSNPSVTGYQNRAISG